MKQTDLDSTKASPEALQALADQIVNRQSGIQNYVLNVAIDFWLVRRLGLEPLSVSGRLVSAVFHFLTILVPALVLTAITRDGSGAALVVWIIVAPLFGGFVSMLPVIYRPAVPDHLSWVRAIVDEADLRRLLAWCRRWYSCEVVAPVAVALTLAALVPFYLLAIRGSGTPMPTGSLYVGAFIVYLVMTNAYCAAMMTAEVYNLTTCNYELYRLSPADSVLVQRSLHGYNMLGAVNVVTSTAGALFILLLLPAGSDLILPVLLFLLLALYVSTGLGVMLPRVVLGRIIRRTKAAEMETLQIRLDNLLPRLEELTEEEYDRMKRFRETHDAIRDSPENLLPLGAILRNVGALLLSTITILITAFAQEWIAWLAKTFQP